MGLVLLAAPLLATLGPATPAATAADDRPVSVLIDAVSPQVGAPGAAIQVSGRLVNLTETPVTDLTVRLQRGPVLETGEDLADHDSDPVEVNEQSSGFVDIAQRLDGLGVVPFSYTTTPEELSLSKSGAYPLLVNVNGRAGDDPASRVGEQIVLLPFFAQAPSAVTRVSWLWPLVATPERNAAGIFTGTSLVTSLGSGGRLDQALDAIETGPPSTATPTATPARVSLALDPELLEAVQILANGDYPLMVAGQPQASSLGSTDAANWLDRLRGLAANLPVIALPYADPDIATLILQDQAPAIERLLPDGDAGALVQQILGVTPDLAIGWPPDGSAGNPAVLELLGKHGVTQVVADEALTFVERPEPSASEAVTSIDTPNGSVTALVADHLLSGLLRTDTSRPGAKTVTEQRFLAELVVTAAAAPARSRYLLLAPPRDFDPRTADALMQVIAGQPWLGSEQVDALTEAVPTPDRRRVLTPDPASSLIPDGQLSQLIGAMRARDDFASALADPDSDLQAVDAALARAATTNRGPDPGLGMAAVRDVAAAVGGLNATVSIVPPANGTYSLASADAPLVLTVVNDNPFPVKVTVALAPRGAPGVTTTNVVRLLPAQTRSTITVPANVQRSGSFTVIATVSTPAGGALGAPIQLRVQSTVYGPVALAITFGAAALLVLLFARRSLKYLQRRRHSRSIDQSATASARNGSSDLSADQDRPADHALVEPPPNSAV